MNDTHKLLMALCEYWGIEVEKTETLNVQYEGALANYERNKVLAAEYFLSHPIPPNKSDFIIVDYKLTKKDPDNTDFFQIGDAVSIDGEKRLIIDMVRDSQSNKVIRIILN